jgi:hypothetical protein
MQLRPPGTIVKKVWKKVVETCFLCGVVKAPRQFQALFVCTP